jgi:hypothetical protein
MSKEQINDMISFLSPFPGEIRDLALWLREFIWDLYPSANELIYDNYNALAVGWSPTEKMSHTFCSIAVGRTSYNIHFGFYWGSKISDPDKLLSGQGNQYRYILVKSKDDFPADYLKKLISEAYAYSMGKVKDPSQLISGQTITKSISAVKRAGKKVSVQTHKQKVK